MCHCVFSRSVGVLRATTLQIRGLRLCVILLMAALASRISPFEGHFTARFRHAFILPERSTQLAQKNVQASEFLASEAGFDQGTVVQFSVANLGTRANSRVLFVTSVSPRLRAWAAMNRSLAPIIVPRVFRAARI